MRFHGLPENLLSSPARTAVIRVLLAHPGKAWTGRELARAAGVTPRWAIKTLRALEAEGLVWAESVPPSMRWTVRRHHALIRLLRPALGADDRARELLERELRRIASSVRPRAALWFGSTACGRETPGSDVDLLVVVENAGRKDSVQAALSRARAGFFQRFGNSLSPIVLTRSEWRARRSSGFVAKAIEEGIWLVGGR